MLERLKPPFLGLHKIPAAELPAAENLGSSLYSVLAFLDVFQLDLQLYDYCMANFWRLEQQDKEIIPPAQLPAELAQMHKLYLSWRGIPVRDGALQIYHFAVALDGIRKTLSMCPTVRDRVDHQALRQAMKDFRAAFPNYEKMRHAVAHIADRTKTPGHTEKHQFVGEHKSANDSGITLSSVVGRQFSVTWEGEVLQYELSENTLQILRGILRAVYAAFPEPLR